MNYSVYRSVHLRDKENEYMFFGAHASAVAMGKTHGCSCCSSEEEITIDKIDEHIAGLEDELKLARKVRRKLIHQQNKEAGYER